MRVFRNTILFIIVFFALPFASYADEDVYSIDHGETRLCGGDFYGIDREKIRETGDFYSLGIFEDSPHIFNWKRLDPIGDFNREWHPDYTGPVYADPDLNSEIVYRGFARYD